MSIISIKMFSSCLINYYINLHLHDILLKIESKWDFRHFMQLFIVFPPIVILLIHLLHHMQLLNNEKHSFKSLMQHMYHI